MGHTLLQRACGRNHLEIVKELIHQGANGNR